MRYVLNQIKTFLKEFEIKKLLSREGRINQNEFIFVQILLFLSIILGSLFLLQFTRERNVDITYISKVISGSLFIIGSILGFFSIVKRLRDGNISIKRIFLTIIPYGGLFLMLFCVIYPSIESESTHGIYKKNDNILFGILLLLYVGLLLSMSIIDAFSPITQLYENFSFLNRTQ